MWEKIVLNLVSNAFKFTQEGEITVRLRQVGEMAELSVRDTGVGIPEQELPRLFERFHQIRGVTGRSLEGTGIGLALVQELVRLHGGSIRVESSYGRGSTFGVSVPLGSALPAPDSGAAAPTLSPPGATSDAAKATGWFNDLVLSGAGPSGTPGRDRSRLAGARPIDGRGGGGREGAGARGGR